MSDRYNIYTLRRVLSLKNTKHHFQVATSATSNKAGSFSFVALYSSNKCLLFRYSSSILDAPRVRYLPWFRDRSKTIVSMSFSGDVKRLLCLCADGSLYVVAAHSLVLRDGLTSQQDVEDSAKHLASYARSVKATSSGGAEDRYVKKNGNREGSSGRSGNIVRNIDLSKLAEQGVILSFGNNIKLHSANQFRSASTLSVSSVGTSSSRTTYNSSSGVQEVDQNDVTDGSGQARSIAWWTRQDNQQEYILIGTTTGKLVILTCTFDKDFSNSTISSSSSSTASLSVPLVANVVTNVAICGSAIVKITLVHDERNQPRRWTYALVRSESGNTYRVPLVFQNYCNDMISIDTTSLWQNSLDIADITGIKQDNTFSPEKITTISDRKVWTDANVHSLGKHRGGNSLGVYYPRDGLLQMIQPDCPLPFQYPLFEFRIPAWLPSTRYCTRPSVLLRNRILFVVSKVKAEKGKGMGEMKKGEEVEKVEEKIIETGEIVKTTMTSNGGTSSTDGGETTGRKKCRHCGNLLQGLVRGVGRKLGTVPKGYCDAACFEKDERERLRKQKQQQQQNQEEQIDEVRQNNNGFGLRIHIMSALVSARLSSCSNQPNDTNQALMQDFRTTDEWSSHVVSLLPAPWLGRNNSSGGQQQQEEYETMGAGEEEEEGEEGEEEEEEEEEEEHLDGVVIVTEDAMYECVPKSSTHLKEEFYKLVTKGRLRQGEMLAQSFGLNVLSMYEHAADRLLRTGKGYDNENDDKINTNSSSSAAAAAALALKLYMQSNAKPTKIIRELVRARRPLLAALYGRQHLERSKEEEESNVSEGNDKMRIVLAYRIVQCYIGASGNNNGDTEKIEELPFSSGSSATSNNNTTFYIPTGSARVADPYAHPCLLHFLETSNDYPLQKTARLLIDHGLIGASLVACRYRQQISYGIQLLLLPSSPRIGTPEIDFLTSTIKTLTAVCTVSNGDLIRTLSFPLQIRFLCHVAKLSPHLLVDLMSLILGKNIYIYIKLLI